MRGEGVITAKCDEGERKVTESRRGWECIAALVFGPMVLPFFPEYGHVILETVSRQTAGLPGARD